MKKLTNEQRKRNELLFYEKKENLILEKLKKFDQRAFSCWQKNKNEKLVESSCYLFGEAGTGKTVEIINLAYSWCKNKYINGSLLIEFSILTVDTLLQEIRDTFGKYKNEIFEQDIITHYSEIPLLVLDDFGVSNTSEWSFRILYMIINNRYKNQRTTFYTSNFSLRKISELLEDFRLTSRIEHDCKENIFEFKGKNYRN